MRLSLIIIFTILLCVLGVIHFNLSKSFSCQVYDKIKENKNRAKDYQGEQI
jgi:ABC-type lipoprotein release transport system permease subunit